MSFCLNIKYCATHLSFAANKYPKNSIYSGTYTKIYTVGLYKQVRYIKQIINLTCASPVCSGASALPQSGTQLSSRNTESQHIAVKNQPKEDLESMFENLASVFLGKNT
jgi:hypothetical protein